MNPYEPPDIYVCEKCLSRKAEDAVRRNPSRGEELLVALFIGTVLVVGLFSIFTAIQMYGHSIVLVDETVNESVVWESFPWK